MRNAAFHRWIIDMTPERRKQGEQPKARRSVEMARRSLLGVVCAGAMPARAQIAWREDIAPGARNHAVQAATLPDGTPGWRFELRPGDCRSDSRNNDCATARERAELRSLIEAPESAHCRYRLRILIPTEYPDIMPEQIIGQFHDSVAPVLSNRYGRGRWSLVVQK